jgi:hypothetical protein
MASTSLKKEENGNNLDNAGKDKITSNSSDMNRRLAKEMKDRGLDPNNLEQVNFFANAVAENLKQGKSDPFAGISPLPQMGYGS